MRTKKAQGLSLNTIIVAIIVMVVLVVIVLIFTGRMHIFAGEVQQCRNNGGKCVYRFNCAEDRIIENIDCREEGKVCCVTVGT